MSAEPVDLAHARRVRDLAYEAQRLVDLIQLARFRADEALEREANEQLRQLHEQNAGVLR
jgi:hypothetical protein